MRYLSFRIFLAILFLSILGNVFNNNKFKLIKELFKNNNTKLEFLIVLVFIFTSYFEYIPFVDKKKAKIATKHAILALLIYFFELLELPTQLFWLIWITAFFLEEWI